MPTHLHATGHLKLYWISPRDVRKNRADPVRVMLDCSGFARLGVDVTLVTPHVHRPEWPVARSEIWRQYGLAERFRIVELPTFYTDRSNPRVVRVQKLVAGMLFALALAAVSLVRREVRLFVVHCQSTSLPLLLLGRAFPLLRWRTFLVLGGFHEPKRHERWLVRNCTGFLAGNAHLRDSVIEHYGVDPARVWLQSPYSYLEAFDDAPTEPACVQPARFPLVGYVGKVGYPPHDDIELLIETARLLPHARFMLVGGNGTSERLYARRAAELGATNIAWVGFKPLPELLPLIRQADVLVAYYPSSDPMAARNRIPAKFALYRCAGKPIVAPDYPGIREVLGDDEAFFVPPDRPDQLARRIEAILSDPAGAEQKGKRALENARRDSLTRYCSEVLEFMTRDPVGRAGS